MFNFTALGVGDPQISTFDGLSYTFNGYGQFILTKTNDGSFEIQAETDVFFNIDNPNITGTFFTSFAMKTNSSPIVEVKLSDSETSPYLSRKKPKQ